MNQIHILNNTPVMNPSSSRTEKDAATQAKVQPILSQMAASETVNQSATALDAPKAAEKLQHALESLQIDYGVKVEMASDDRGKIFVRIMSQDGERVLRQMPPDSLIKLHASLKHNRGMLGSWLA